MSPRRYALADLLEATGLTESGLTRRAGISGTTLKNAREMGFTADAADRYAARCGLHPGEVWRDWFDVEFPITGYDMDELEIENKNMRPCAAHGCDEPLPDDNPRRRYCSKRCKRRVEGRKYQAQKYATDPDFRANKKVKRADFYKQCGEYEKARERRKYAQDPEKARARSKGYYDNNAEALRQKARERRSSTACGEELSHASETVAA